MPKTNLKEISFLFNEINSILIRVILTAINTNDEVALKAIGIDSNTAAKLLQLNDIQRLYITENYPLANLSINQDMLKLAINNTQDIELSNSS